MRTYHAPLADMPFVLNAPDGDVAFDADDTLTRASVSLAAAIALPDAR